MDDARKQAETMRKMLSRAQHVLELLVKDSGEQNDINIDVVKLFKEHEDKFELMEARFRIINDRLDKFENKILDLDSDLGTLAADVRDLERSVGQT